MTPRLVEVARASIGVAPRLLRRHVAVGADHAARREVGGLARQLHETEVHQTRPARVVHHDVRGLRSRWTSPRPCT